MKIFETFKEFICEKTTSLNPEPKDYKRIEDMVNKSKDDKHLLALAQNMANKITDYSKAIRRAKAAEDENYHEVAKIFYERAADL